ncbi:MAG: TlpA family protein disulfide reductase [Candidatus Kapabacteria bacterium]|nr:TlpA family protein disulfide reductase [Candidatus Kapabacteria bacterium]
MINKILILSIIFLNLLSVKLNSGILKIQPEYPIENQEVNFQYFPDKDQNIDSCKAIIYLFKSGFIEPEAQELNLFKQDNYFSNKYLINKDIVFALIKVDLGEIYDLNFQEFWDFTVSNYYKVQKKDAHYFKAFSYLGSLPENCQRLPNFTKAIEYFEKELIYYPDNTLANLSLLLINYDSKRISENEFKSSVKKIYDKNSNNLDESATVLLIRALKLIKEDQKAERIENSFISKNPLSKLAQEYELRQLSRIKNYSEFNQKSFNFLDKYPNSNLTEKVWTAIIQSYIQNNQLDDIVEKITQYDNIPYSVYNRLIFNLLKNKSKYSQTEIENITYELIQKSLSKLNEDIKYKKPNYYSTSEWEKISKVNLSKFYQDWGDILSILNKPNESLEKYLSAIELLKSDFPISLTESTVLLATQINNNSLALELTSQAILDSKSSNFIDSVFKDVYSKIYNNSQAPLDSLKRIADVNRRKRIEKNLLQLQLELTIQSPDNTLINLNNYKGNILVLTLWGKWCEPCLDLLTFFERYDKNQLNRENIILLPINTLDTDRMLNSKFLKQNNVNLMYYNDINDEIALNLGFTGLPATIFIDKLGIIRYIEKGFLDKESYEQILNDIILILNK